MFKFYKENYYTSDKRKIFVYKIARFFFGETLIRHYCNNLRLVQHQFGKIQYLTTNYML